MENIQDKVAATKESLPEVTPTPPSLKPSSSASDLKARLDWGEPALTIIDVRDRQSFNKERIMGAIAMPMDQLVERVRPSLEPTRDIYVYGDTDQETAQAATRLREAGFINVAELKGALAGWRAISGSIEGTATAATPR
ncbi:rhodanese-like domain-containing protein [Lyngbya aestuarii]|uniref:rhodanese-like domain-containing protein n=1 Tax=Lyngbya aestuarii TaxID=118322 RepID=UPI00403DD649